MRFPFELLSALILIVSTVSTNASSCPSKLLQKCICGLVEYDFQTQYVVNCTNTRFRNTDALEELPDETQVLIFTGNLITELPWNVFGVLNKLDTLRVIDMSNNGIRDIRGKSYHHVTNVQRLILNHNNISISSDDIDEVGIDHHHPRVFSNFVNLLELHLTNAFQDNTNEELSNDLHDIFVNSNLTLLMKLHLEQNEIKSFGDRNVFCDLPNLRDLHLGDNLLSEINFNLLCLKKLGFLDLQRNKFKSLSMKDVAVFDKLAFPYRNMSLTIDIGKNPLVCDRLRVFGDWLAHTNVVVRNKDTLFCRTSRGNRLPVKQLLLMRNSSIQARNTRLFIALTALSIFALLCGLLYRYRKSLFVNGRPILDRFNSSVRYTTIEPQSVHL